MSANDSAIADELTHLHRVRRQAPDFRFVRRVDANFDGIDTYFDDDSSGSHEVQLFWSEHIRTLLCGVHDNESPLSILRGHEETILQSVYTMVMESWSASVTRTPPAHSIGRMRYERSYHTNIDVPVDPDVVTRNDHSLPMMTVRFVSDRSYVEVSAERRYRPQIAFSSCGEIKFPKPLDINVNMMPFVMGKRESLPEELRAYYDAAITKCPLSIDEMGKVCYLTVQEGFVKEGATQRRGGIHTEAPGSLRVGGNFIAGWEHSWGFGMAYSPDELQGGIFMASNMNESTELFDALVDHSYDVADSHGGIQHLRSFLGEGTKLRANELVWLTDKTPHAALPQAVSGYRQYFRLVTSNISLWFEDHSTANPLVDLPADIKIFRGSKFQTQQKPQNP